MTAWVKIQNQTFLTSKYKLKSMEGYRKNVAMVVLNDKQNILICRRKGTENWQFPQGGIDENELIEEAMYRELYEEVGLKKNDVSIVGKTNREIRYDIPKTIRSRVLGGKFKGQLQTWFLLRLEEKSSSINLDHDPSPEFDRFDWVSYWFPLSKIVDFKREAYREALYELRKFL